MAKCKVCGSRVPDGTAQCPMCGAKIATAQGAAQSPAQPTPQAQPVRPTPSAQPQQPSRPAPQPAPASSGSKCKVCGNRIPLGASACPMCGAKVAGATPTPQTPPVQPTPQPAQPTYQPQQPQQPTPQPSYQPSPSQNPPKEKKGCLSKIITAILVIIGIIVALIFVANGFDIEKTVSDVGDIASGIADSYSTPKDVPIEQYQVTTYRDYELHPEKYYGKYVVFKRMCVTYVDRTGLVLYERKTQTSTNRIAHSYTGQYLDWLAKKNNSFNHYNFNDTVSLYCYISKTGDFKPIRLEEN